MKKYLLLVLILFKFYTASIGQTYYPFPTITAKWNIRVIQGFLDPGAVFPIIMEGDTIINTITYKKLFLYNQVYGGIREENKVIYFYRLEYEAEYPLYDFTKEVGDTIHGVYDDIYSYLDDPESFHSMIVMNIDSLLLTDGNYHKRFQVVASYFGSQAYWIEGVGSPDNVISPGWNSSSVSGTHHLDCLVGDGDLVYGTCVSSISENSQKEFIQIYPNPFSDFTNISSKKYLKNATLRIYNTTGKLVNEINNIFGENFVLQRNNLPEGIYTIQLLQDNKIIGNERFVVLSDN